MWISKTLINFFLIIICFNATFVIKPMDVLNKHNLYEIRYYSDHPWIFNNKSSKNIPKLRNDGMQYGSLIALMIKLKKDDIRALFVKDNKAYAMNCAGMEEENDICLDNDYQTSLNTAKRELFEEINIDILDNQLEKIGFFEYTNKNNLLNGATWKVNVVVFSCYLNAKKTQNWLSKFNIIDRITDENVNKFLFKNDEIESIFLVKPEEFIKNDIIVSQENEKIIKISSHHADIAAAVLKGKFKKNILIGRGVNYLDGQIQYGNTNLEFVNSRK